MSFMSFLSAPAAARTPGNPHVGHAPDTGGLVDLLEIVVNNRLRTTWRVKVDFRTGERVLSVPPVLSNPPEDVKECLIRWALMPMSRKANRKPAYVKNKKELESKIRAYMESRGVQKQPKSRLNPLVFTHQTKGFVFDLREIFDKLNRVYFKDELKSYIRWGRGASLTSYQTSKIDKDGNLFNLITISGVYDSPHVPEYALYGLVYHEMLHIAIPPKNVNGRRVVHGRDFKDAMRKYPFYDDWLKWEKANMGKLISSARRRLKKIKIKR